MSSPRYITLLDTVNDSNNSPGNMIAGMYALSPRSAAGFQEPQAPSSGVMHDDNYYSHTERRGEGGERDSLVGNQRDP